METKTLKERLAEQHPEYTANVGMWELFRDAYYSTGGFTNGGNLVKYDKEAKSSFSNRRQTAHYANYCRPVINTNVGHMFKKAINRQNPTSGLDAFYNNPTLAGNENIDSFMKEAARQAQVYGHCYVVVDMPNMHVETKLDEAEHRIRPYAYILTPTDIIDWSVDKSGTLSWIKIKELVRDDAIPLADHKMSVQYRLWERHQWTLYSDKGEVLDQGNNPLGRVPVVTVYNVKRIQTSIGVSEIQDIAQINKSLYNRQSELTDLFRSQGFAMIAYPGQFSEKSINENGELEVTSLTSMTVLGYSEESKHKPEYIAPPASTTDALTKEIDKLVTQILDLAKQNFAAGVATSGVSLRFRFEQTNQNLVSKAINMESAEVEIAELVTAWTGEELSDDFSVSYPRDFAIEDRLEELKVAFEALSMNLGNKFETKYKQQLAKRLLPKASKKTIDVINRDIEEQSLTSINEELDGA